MSGQSLLSNTNWMPAIAFTLTIGENTMSMNMISKAWNVKLNSPIQKLVLIALAETADCRIDAFSGVYVVMLPEE